MIEKRPFELLGHANHGWLDAYHHFSFASYHNPNRMNWGNLRVWNDDTIAPGSGFPFHPHENMEIITYVRKGAISHEDSLGNKGKTKAGDVQVMSAGTGIMHSEYNAENIPTEIFQIWIYPEKTGGKPSWDSKPFPEENRIGKFSVLASGFSSDTEALPIRTNARVLGTRLKSGQEIIYKPETGTSIYIVASSGKVTINDIIINTRDGVAIRDESELRIIAQENAELVMVETHNHE